MLVELSVVEQRYHAVMEVISGGVPVVEVAERLRGIAQDGARLASVNGCDQLPRRGATDTRDSDCGRAEGRAGRAERDRAPPDRADADGLNTALLVQS